MKQDHAVISSLHDDAILDPHVLLIAKWRPPPDGFLKLDVDGSYSQEHEVMGGGGVLRDHSGTWIAGFMSRKDAGTPFLAETWALLNGLVFAWDRGVRQVDCTSDNKELVQLLLAPSVLRDQIHAGVLRTILALMQRNWQVRVSWCAPVRVR